MMKNFWDEPSRRLVFIQPPKSWVKALFQVVEVLIPTCECLFLDNPKPLLADQQRVYPVPTPTCCLIDLDSPVSWCIPPFDGVTFIRLKNFLGPIIAVSRNTKTVEPHLKRAASFWGKTHALVQLPIRLARFIELLKQLRGEPESGFEQTKQELFYTKREYRDFRVARIIHYLKSVFPAGKVSPSDAKELLDLTREDFGDSWDDFPILSEFHQLAENGKWGEIAALAERESSSKRRT